MQHITPKLGATHFTCPHCHTVSQLAWERIRFGSDYRGTFFVNEISASRCNVCGKNTIFIKNELVYPSLAAPEPNADMSESILELYQEAGEIYGKSPRAACALLRLAIDRLCNELGEKDRDIDKNIASLVEKGLPQKVQQALDVVRVVGNKAVHPGQIAFDVDNIDTAVTLFRLINMIVNNTITEPKEIDGYFQQLPNSAKEAVAKRDDK